ncbi:sugar ABC transporter permease [bacterium]|nr:sugar ABC transporter permease [bacterium]
MNKNNFYKLSYKEKKVLFLFLLPLLSFIFLFVFIPILGTFINSFHRDLTFLPKKFIFLDNFKRLLTDNSFWQSIRFTLLFTFISVPLQLVIGFIFAILLNKAIPFRGLIRSIVLIPWAVPAAISARAWELIYNYNYGLAQYIIKSLGITQNQVNFLGSAWSAFWALILADSWKTAPFIAIIILAGLSSIPQEIYRQAKIDGAGFIYIFFKITVPIIKPIIIAALLFRTIDSLRIFDLIYVLTHGGPGGSTASASIYGYQFFLSGEFGYGSCVSVFLFIITFIISICYIKTARFGEKI